MLSLFELISILMASGVGCYYINRFAAALMYADDLTVLAPTLKGLQKLLFLCEKYCADWDIKLNPSKTKNLFFGKGSVPTSLFTLNGSSIGWVQKCKYLGVTLVQGPRFGCCVEETLMKYYRAANAVLRVDGRSDDMIMLQLLETHCLSILSYAIEVVDIVDRRQKSKMRVAYNSMFRKLFNYSWRESVTELQHALGRPTWEELIATRYSNFLARFQYLPEDSLVRHLII